MEIEVEEREDVRILSLIGRLDIRIDKTKEVAADTLIDFFNRLIKQIEEVLDLGCKKILFNFSKIEYASVNEIFVVGMIISKLRLDGKKIKVLSTLDHKILPIRVFSSKKLFDVCDSIEEAIESFRK